MLRLHWRPIDSLRRLRHDSGMVPELRGEHEPEDDTALLIAALNHALAWYETRIDRGLQVINYFVVAGAVLVTGYASAFGGRHYGIAVAIGLTGMALAALAFVIGRGQRRFAREAQPALAELQGRLASKLQLPTLAIARPEPGRTGGPVALAFALAVFLGGGSAIYAAIH
jgi:hypothetical protein